MSENQSDTPKITTIKKENDPKRVEAGKQLAKISKEAKERKMREKIEAERIEEEKDKSWNIDYGFLFGLVGFVSAIGALYYARREDIRETKEENELEHEQKNAVVEDKKSINKVSCLDYL